MDLLKTILESAGGKNTSELAGRFGLDEKQVESALGQLIPALSAGVKRNAGNAQGLDALMGAIGSGGHERYLDQPEMVREPASIDEGNGILGHLLGSKDVSREVAAQASVKTGIDSGILKQMLPAVAPMLMGALSKNKHQIAPGGKASPDGLAGLLDFDGDGSVVDDVSDLLKKLF